MTSGIVFQNLRIDGLRAGSAFVSSPEPVFSWQLNSDRPGTEQTSCRIVVRDAAGNLLRDSELRTDLSAAVAWTDAAPLPSRCRAVAEIEVRCAGGETVSSGPVPFETALFSNSDWSAGWIHFDGGNPSTSSPCPYFRREFFVRRNLQRARLYLSARGLFRASLNGARVGNDRFVPGWVDFAKETPFLSYDVTSLLKPGAANAAGSILGDGWYCGYLSGRRRSTYGTFPELLFQLEMEYADGLRETLVSDADWKCATGPILASDIYDGEIYDARLEMPGWDCAGFDDSSWKRVSPGLSASEEKIPLVPRCCPPVRPAEERKAERLLHPRQDVWIWDFGQNISGVFRITFHGVRGTLYTFRVGEMLNSDGTLYTLNYRSARSTDFYTPRGPFGQTETYEPEFTFHGFRYLQIDGFQFAGSLRAEDLDVTAVVLHSELEPAGTFVCGHGKLNRLYSNIRWGQLDNFFEIPTDCPQRDERLGWTGDAQVFCGAAACNFNVSAFFRKYLRDLREAQRPDGAVPCVAPDILHVPECGAGWSDASAVIPWTMYLRYGDLRFLSENYSMMKRWVDYVVAESGPDLIRVPTPYGDWLAFSKLETPSELIGTAYFAFSARTVAKAAEILGNKADAERYGKLASGIVAAFRKHFLSPEGTVNPPTQTGFALALHFDLLPEELRRKNADYLDSLIRANGNRLDTGFIGTACLNLALSESGKSETARNLWLQEEFPSWLFPVNQGATTVWERWNSYTVRDGFGDVNMNSFNHYAYGAVQEWVFLHVCGIRHASPGGKKLLFAAEPDERIGFVESSLETPYGLAESCWKFESSSVLSWRVSAPANTRMEIRFPAGWSCDEPSGIRPCGKYEFRLTRLPE